jgi:hypothetical protein
MIPTRLAVVLPPLLLLGVAATQMVLARTAHLSPWKGGGFGMFASVDGMPFRQVRVYVAAPSRSEELRIPASLEDATARAATFPHRRALEALAWRFAERERRHVRDAETVRVEVWRADFSPALDATHTPLRVVTVSVGEGAAQPTP